MWEGDGEGEKRQPLTFPLDLEHADGILGAEAAELTGGQRVAALAPGRILGAPQASGLEERRGAEHRHPAPLPARGGVFIWGSLRQLRPRRRHGCLYLSQSPPELLAAENTC